MGKNTPVFVAETDENGRVLWVWRSDDPRYPPRPIGNVTRHLTDLKSARFSGAPSAAIVDWLQTRAATRPAIELT